MPPNNKSNILTGIGKPAPDTYTDTTVYRNEAGDIITRNEEKILTTQSSYSRVGKLIGATSMPYNILELTKYMNTAEHDFMLEMLHSVSEKDYKVFQFPVNTSSKDLTKGQQTVKYRTYSKLRKKNLVKKIKASYQARVSDYDAKGKPKTITIKFDKGKYLFNPEFILPYEPYRDAVKFVYDNNT